MRAAIESPGAAELNRASFAVLASDVAARFRVPQGQADFLSVAEEIASGGVDEGKLGRLPTAVHRSPPLPLVAPGVAARLSARLAFGGGERQRQRRDNARSSPGPQTGGRIPRPARPGSARHRNRGGTGDDERTEHGSLILTGRWRTAHSHGLWTLSQGPSPLAIRDTVPVSRGGAVRELTGLETRTTASESASRTGFRSGDRPRRPHPCTGDSGFARSDATSYRAGPCLPPRFCAAPAGDSRQGTQARRRGVRGPQAIEKNSGRG